MKKYVKIFMLLSLSLLFIHCEDSEVDVQPPLSIGFERNTVKVLVDPEVPTYELKVYSTQTSNVDRVIGVSLNEEGSTGLDTEYEYSFNSITIPAGSFFGSAEIHFDFDVIPMGVDRRLIFDLDVDDIYHNDAIVNSSTKSVIINYSPLCIENSIILDLVFDQYAEETSWELYNSDLALVASGGQGGEYEGIESISVIWCLESGVYTFAIYDAYGDGFCCAYGDGSYTITHGDDVLVSEAGDFGASEIISFVIE